MTRGVLFLFCPSEKKEGGAEARIPDCRWDQEPVQPSRGGWGRLDLLAKRQMGAL